MASTEDIEAKLCAYIEGVLDPADQAEIEKHLEANPHHRALLAELARTRSMVQGLPRESAPDEILEAVQSQLERTALLQDTDTASSASMRINRLPQVLAMAAVLLLTVGLGVVIYFILPRSNRTANYAVVPMVSTSPAAPGTDVMSDMDAALGLVTTAPSAAVAGVDGPPITTDAFAANEPLPMVAEPELDAAREMIAGKGGATAAVPSVEPDAQKRLAKESNAVAGIDFEAAREQFANADIARKLKTTPDGLRENSLFVVVTTDDTRSTKDQVAGFLASNSIRYEEVMQAPPELLAIDETQDVLASRQAPVQEYRLKSAPASLPAEDKAGERELSQRDRAAQAEPTRTDPEKTVASKSAGHPPAGLTQSGVEETVVGSDVQAAQQRMEKSQLVVVPGAIVTEHPQNLIVARSMTRGQAEALHETLSNQTNVYRANLYDQPDVPGVEAPAPTDGQPTSFYSRLSGMLKQPALELSNGTDDVLKSEQVAATAESPAVQQQAGEFASTQRAGVDVADEVIDVVIVLKDPIVGQSMAPVQPLQQQADEPAAPTSVPASDPPADLRN